MKRSAVAELVTAVHLQESWVKVLQARVAEEGKVSLLGMKARKPASFSEEGLADALRDLIRTLPEAPRQVLGLLSSGEVLTRYLMLPSDDPEELKAMALYQMEGLLPFPIQECVTSIKVLGPVGEATRVLVVAAHRPVVERILRVCRRAGLTLSGIASSSEAIGQLHRACWPSAPALSSVWLIAERTREGLELGVLVKGSLVYMRQIPHSAEELEGLAAQLQETIQAYQRERVGPAVDQVTLSGSLEDLGPGALERLERSLELPVHGVDPLESSPFAEALAVTAQELAPEVSFSELLGAACAPRLLELDLLPAEIRLQQAKLALLGEVRRTAFLILLAAAVAAGWLGSRVVGNGWWLKQTRMRIQMLEPRVAQVKAMAGEVRATAQARAKYALQLQALKNLTQNLTPGMTLQFLGLEAGRAVTLRGSAPDLSSVSNLSVALRKEPFFKSVTLSSAKTRQEKEVSRVEFELVLKTAP